jgi:aromatase
MGYIRNVVAIEAPLDEVFRITNDVRIWPELFSEYKSCEVLEEKTGDVTFRLTTHPDENGQTWSWISRRQSDFARKSTYSEREPDSGPFARMEIRWWYDGQGSALTLMTWEQEFTMRPTAPVSEQGATDYLNKHTKIQQQVIKERVEKRYQESLKAAGSGSNGTGTMNGMAPTRTDAASADDSVYRGVIIGRYQQGSEDAIIEAFRRSDDTELPHILGVKSRHVWVLGDIYMHFVEGQSALPHILREHATDPLFKNVKAELDRYVKPLTPELYPGVAREIYHWTPGQIQAGG